MRLWRRRKKNGDGEGGETRRWGSDGGGIGYCGLDQGRQNCEGVREGGSGCESCDGDQGVGGKVRFLWFCLDQGWWRLVLELNHFNMILVREEDWWRI